jgi:DNA-binding MarR family transcriptional regulator
MATANEPSAGESDGERLLRDLRLCYWKVMSRLDDRLGESGLTSRQVLFLKTLSEIGACNSRALCEAMAVTPADITGLADRLQAGKFIRRVRARVDRRQVILEMTDKGRKALAKAQEIRERFLKDLLKEISDQELRVMLSGLDRILEFLDRASPLAAARSRAQARKPSGTGG